MVHLLSHIHSVAVRLILLYDSLITNIMVPIVVISLKVVVKIN